MAPGKLFAWIAYRSNDCSVIMVFSGVFTFLVDAYPTYAASALAANGFSRSMFAAAFPLFGQASKSRASVWWIGG